MSPRLVLGALLLIVAAAGCQGANPHQIVGAVMGTGPGGSNIFSDLRGATVDIDEPDEADLGGVHGHEVGHVALKHHGEAIKDQKRKAVLARGAQIAGASFSQSAPFVGLIGVMVDGVIEQTLIKGFSRNEEMASDKVGFQYAARAGYEPAGLRGFLAALKAKSAD